MATARVRVVFLGTGASWPTAERNSAALALETDAGTLLFDCGEGTQRQLARSPARLDDVSHVFVTHLHGDHVLGLPGLLWAIDHATSRTELAIHGPPGTGAVVERFAELLVPEPSLDLRVEELGEGSAVSLSSYEVLAARLDHTDPNLGYALLDPDQDDRIFAYTGDCRPDPATVRLARGAAVLVHDGTFAEDAQMANPRGHSTARQAAEIARQADVDALYLTHVSARFDDPTPIEAAARAVFPCAHVAADLDTVELPS